MTAQTETSNTTQRALLTTVTVAWYTDRLRVLRDRYGLDSLAPVYASDDAEAASLAALVDNAARCETTPDQLAAWLWQARTERLTDSGLLSEPRGYDQLAAHLGTRQHRRLANNTYVYRDAEAMHGRAADVADVLAVRLHATDILTFWRYRDGSTMLRINTGKAPGWYTRTTLDRINSYAPIGVEIQTETQSRRDAERHGYVRDYDDVYDQLAESGWYSTSTPGGLSHLESAADRAARQRWTLVQPDGTRQPFDVAASVAL